MTSRDSYPDGSLIKFALPKMFDGGRNRNLVFGFGHSHMQTLVHQYPHWQIANKGKRTFELRQLLAPPYQLDGRVDDARTEQVGDLLAAEIAELERKTHSQACVFTWYSGNEYHQFSLVNHERPYDYVDPALPHLPLREGAEILPYAAIKEAMRVALARSIGLLERTMARIDRPLLYLSPLPPIPDNNYLQKSEGHFKAMLGKFGPSPKELRFKLWFLQNSLMKEVCARNGWTFMDPPPEALDEGGFLREEAWLGDAVHASHWYANLMLDKISKTADSGWI